MPGTAPPRVVVADDSALMRAILSRSLADAGIDVVGKASDGAEALELCEREQPDALTLDLAMPGVAGIEVLRTLRERRADIPVVVVSAFSAKQGAYAVEALAEGAFDLVTKPAGNDELESFKQSLGAKVRLAARERSRRTVGAFTAAPPRRHFAAATKVARVVVIATSTGGPRALSRLLPKLPSPLGVGTLIVQHMPPGFTGSLAARLDAASELEVREAEGGEQLDPGRALIAPGGRHLRLLPQGHTALSDEPAIGGLRPRADLLIEDAARMYGERILLVVMTGMGNDGLSGAREVRRRGGRILVEAEDSCTVYGMPRAVADAGLADEILSLDDLAAAITAEAHP